MASHRGAETVFVIDPPMKPGSPGFHKVIDNEDDYGFPFTQSEGGILTRAGQALLMPTRDCSVLTIVNLMSNDGGAVHCSRESLINRNSGCCEHLGVVERLIAALDIRDGAKAAAYITGGIGASKFEHQDISFVEPFMRLYGEHVVTDKSRGTLDLVAVITAKLHAYGIKNVHHDGLCTYDHPSLGSVRAQRAGIPNKDQANWTLVVKTR